MIEAAFVILLTFVADADAENRYTKTLYCRDEACVEVVISQGYESPYLRRLRVFTPGDLKGYHALGNTSHFPPKLDLTFN